MSPSKEISKMRKKQGDLSHTCATQVSMNMDYTNQIQFRWTLRANETCN